MHVHDASNHRGSTILRALEGGGLLHHAQTLCSLDPNQFSSLQMQDYEKYGVHSSEDKNKLFRVVKAENYGRSRVTADEIGLLRAEVERQGKQQPARRQSTVFNSKPYAANNVDARPAEKAADSSEESKIRVIVRKRPLNVREVENNEEDTVETDMELGSVVVNEPKTKVDLTKYTERHGFAFDGCLDENVTNDDVYKLTVQSLVTTVFRQGKATCFAYGQTGSGKTYTMQPLPLRAAADIFTLLADPKYNSLQLWVSCFEIYSGKLYDLLNNRKRLEAREDSKKTVQIVGLKEVIADTVPQIKELLEVSKLNRSTGCTGANADSSRSHCILQFVLKQYQQPAKRGDSLEVTPMGKVSFIDLAGSERGADTSDSNRTTRLEGAEINKSLLALKECIRALDNSARHVPFRGSKLTEVLRDSFMGEEARTVMIANVSPNSASCEHTLNTLRYADRVKELKKGKPTGAAAAVDILMKAKAPPVIVKGRHRISSSDGGDTHLRPSIMAAAAQIPNPMIASRDDFLADEAASEDSWLMHTGNTPEKRSQPYRTSASGTPQPPPRREQAVREQQVVGSPLQPRRPHLTKNSAPTHEAAEPYAEAKPDDILDLESELMTDHRHHIETHMRLVRLEMNMLAKVDQGADGLLDYAESLAKILQQKADMNSRLQQRLEDFRRALRRSSAGGIR